MAAPVRLQPRERRLALIALVLIGCWALVSWVVQPLWERVRDLQLRVEAQTKKLDALSQLLAQEPSIRRAYEAVAVYLEAGDEAQTQREFLNELEALSRSTRTQLNLKPRPIRQDGRLSRFEVELDLEGSQRDLMRFLDELLGMPRLIALNRLRILGVPQRKDVLRATLVIQHLTLRAPGAPDA
jgi:Tfp pilus assembly protein PilO